MNSQFESEQFDIKHEEDVLPITKIKIEHQDIKSEITTEEDEYGHFYVKQEILPCGVATSIYNISKDIKCEINTEEECDTFPKHNNTECEFENVSHMASTLALPQEERTHESSNIFLKNCEKKPQEKQKNTEEDDISVVPIIEDISQNYAINFEEKCDIDIYENRERNANVDGSCNNSFLQHTIINHAPTYRNEEPLACNLFKMSLSKKSELDKPAQKSTKVKSFLCNVCNNSFLHNSLLVRHYRTHTNEKPFACNICSRSFSEKSHLTQHKRSHTNEKPFTCDICSKSFKYKRNLVEHGKIHTNVKPFACNLCGKSFLKKYILTQHVRTHTNEKPFTCDMCNRSFSLKSNLIKHTRVHEK